MDWLDEIKMSCEVKYVEKLIYFRSALSWCFICFFPEWHILIRGKPCLSESIIAKCKETNIKQRKKIKLDLLLFFGLYTILAKIVICFEDKVEKSKLTALIIY